ncbi:L-amino acid oxidase-like protein LaoA [Aureobasidium sp. EXF-3400]|nr:L-amino acid oxidase-like protein LaoA [Aureobasidium sp. EXF-12344]KAI4769400.1 L-amino acid oxidase-like protein LaoA [Aureobasidium sp. EXF-3400]
MSILKLSTGVFALSTLIQHAVAAPSGPVISFKFPEVVEAGGMHNVHVDYHSSHDGEFSIVYGDCDIKSTEDAHHILGTTHVGNHDLAKRHLNWHEQRPTRFVWLAPEEMSSDGCLHAFSGDVLLGRSTPVSVGRRNNKRHLAASEIMDAMGPWFDGVTYLKEKEPESVFVAQTKSKSVGILGGGMSGLMTAHILDSVGFHDWQIIEASSRIGGRVHTSYLNATKSDQYQYQEMGPMRFPYSLTLDNETVEINDHKMVFQLADELNKQNQNDPAYHVKFIPWIQSALNDPSSTTKRKSDGTVPGVAEVKENPSLAVNTTATYSNATAVTAAVEEYEDWLGMDTEKTRLYATNVFKAHKQAVAEGFLDFSESGYLRYKMGQDKNITDQIDSVADNLPSWPYEDVYFEATEWRTIDQGLSRLPAAFGPQVLNRTRFQTSVQAMTWNETSKKMSVQFRPGNPFDMETESIDFDYTIVAVPFSKVRLWRLPDYSSLLSRAIARLNYSPACKVALHYKTRFWEHLPRPVIGGCGSGGGIAGIGSVCYPSYQLNSSGPGVILASYLSGDMAKSLGAMTETEHVAYVQRAMIEIHGPIAAEQYTGAYDRKCWMNDEYQAGAWASPTALQQDLYLPAYFQTEKHTVFVGEHTSYTHAWIFSALESAVRGITQLLLDMGLVDEAKQVTEFWMARWISM